jgi:hypothetical protein
MSWYGRIWKGVKRVFTRTEIDARDYVSVTKKQLKSAGIATNKRWYILRSVAKFSKSTPTISVRQYQQAQHGLRIEKRAELYKSGSKPRLTRQSQTHYPRKLSHGRYRYEDIPWDEMPDYYGRVAAYLIQVLALGQTASQYEGQSGAAWRSIFVGEGHELPSLVDYVNSERGYKGFNIHNPPDLGTIHVWKKGRFKGVYAGKRGKIQKIKGLPPNFKKRNAR